MISVWAESDGGIWYAVASHEDRLVATATGTARDRAVAAVCASLPRGRDYRLVERGPEYARQMVRLLAGLESGREEAPIFELCPDCVGEPRASIAHVASRVPRGYVTTYGAIAVAAGTEARVVGHVMATNPLYPIIPCHRVVGADFSLVGYTGSTGVDARRVKLERLRAEARGFAREMTLPAAATTGSLPIYPVERVLEQAVHDGLDGGGQLSLF